jgi:hypothetical protein
VLTTTAPHSSPWLPADYVQASADIAAVEAKIEAEIAPFQAAVDQLDEITGSARPPHR